MNDDRMKKSNDLKKYYTLGLPLLGLMAVIAVLGIIATVLVRHFF